MNNSSYTTQNDLLLKNLQYFYNTEIDGCYDPNNNLDKMLRIITGESKISLRIVDWFATNDWLRNDLDNLSTPYTHFVQGQHVTANLCLKD